MSEIDRVFARFRDDKTPSTESQGQRSIPKRGTQGSRTVEVVHVRSGSPSRPADQSRAPTFGVRAASWAEGFPARDAEPPFPDAPKPTVAALVAPTFHVMPARSPLVPAAGAAPMAPDPEPVMTSRRDAGLPRKQLAVAPARRIADPFDPEDDGANCLRCGYAVEQGRERRGLLTCEACG